MASTVDTAKKTPELDESSQVVTIEEDNKSSMEKKVGLVLLYLLVQKSECSYAVHLHIIFCCAVYARNTGCTYTW